MKKSQDRTLEEKTDALIVRAGAVVVVDQNSLTAANGFFQVLKDLGKEIAAVFDPIIKKAHEAHGTALEAKRKHLEPVTRAKKLLGDQIAAYDTEQERIRKEAEAQALLEAAKKERIRKEAEEAAAWEKFQAESEGDTKKVKEMERMEKAGGVEEHDFFPTEYQTEPVPAKPEMTGIQIRKTWKWKVTNINLVPRELFMLDEPKIGGIVRREKGNTRISGIEAYSVKTTV